MHDTKISCKIRQKWYAPNVLGCVVLRIMCDFDLIGKRNDTYYVSFL